MTVRPSTWVCIPTFNEAENVAEVLARALSAMDGAGIDGHVLVIDDGSPDGTAEIVEAVAAGDARVHLLRRTAKEGIGPAYLAGFRHALDAGADLVLEMDCDLSHDPSDIPRLVEAARNADLVIGSRYVRGGGVRRWGAGRRAISRAGCWYARRVLGLGVRDLTGGFKCFRRVVLETLPLDRVSTRGYGFQIELTALSLAAGFRVVEVPIIFTERVAGASKMSAGIALEAMLMMPRLRRDVRREAAGAAVEVPSPQAEGGGAA